MSAILTYEHTNELIMHLFDLCTTLCVQNCSLSRDYELDEFSAILFWVARQPAQFSCCISYLLQSFSTYFSLFPAFMLSYTNQQLVVA